MCIFHSPLQQSYLNFTFIFNTHYKSLEEQGPFCLIKVFNLQVYLPYLAMQG